MPSGPFRFVHASDFHLEQPVFGLAEAPDHLRDLLLDAAYQAAGHVFDTALAEDADFLVLAGDLLDPHYAGPRGPLFLAEQFARLAERQIAVYWAGGAVDPPEAWPSALRLPANVRVFPQGRGDEFLHERDGAPLVRVVGISRDKEHPIRAADFARDPAGLYTVAVAYGAAETGALQARGIDYWALGGRHERCTPLGGPQIVHYPGSPQGRLDETGPHGCTLVEVDADRQARATLVPTDALRFVFERVVVEPSTTRSGLESLLRERLHAAFEAAPRMPLLISWTLSGSGPLLGQVRRGELGGELLAWLRSEYGFAAPPVWSVSLEAECPAALPPEWFEQETIRGDFLRAIRHLEMNPDEPLGLESFLPEERLAAGLASAVAIPTSAVRGRVLREAALLGIELLSGEEPQL